MRFLREAYRKQRRRMLLEQWLLLATRCLLIAMVALAIGRLAVGALGARAGPRTVYLLIDNSLTSGARAASDATALEAHKRAALGLIESLDASRGDRAGLVAVGAPAAPMIVPASGDLAGVREAVERIGLTDARADWNGALGAVREAIEGGSEGEGPAGRQAGAADRIEVALISAWRAGSVTDGEAIARLDADEVLVSRPADRPASNVAASSVEPARGVLLAGGAQPGATAPVRVGLERFGPIGPRGRAGRVVLRARAEQGAAREIGRRAFELAPGSRSSEVVVPTRLDRFGDSAARRVVLEARLASGTEADAEVGGAIARDDMARRVVTLRERFRVGVVAPASIGGGGGVESFTQADWLEAALAPRPGARLELARIEPRAVSTPRLTGLDGVIVARPDLVGASAWARLDEFATGGGLVLIAPPAEADSHEWASAMNDALGLDIELGLTAQQEEAGVGIDAQESGSALLELVRGEFERLAQPIEVSRWLEAEAGGGVERVVMLRNGAPMVLAIRRHGEPGAETGLDPGSPESSSRRGGVVIVLTVAFDPSWTTLPVKPLAVPLVQELVRQGIAEAAGARSGRAGELIGAPPGTRELVLTDAGATGRPGAPEPARVRVRAATGLSREPIRRAGTWVALDGHGGVTGVIAVEPDLRAADTSRTDPQRVRAWLEDGLGTVAWLDGPDEGAPAEDGRREDSGEPALASAGGVLSAWFFAAALALALVETVLARVASHASVSAGGRA